VLDTPGLRAFGLAADDEAISAAFADVADLAAACRFRDCAHEGEPGCAVAAAVTAGDLPAERLAAYGHLRREAARFEVSAQEQRRVGKQFARRVRLKKRLDDQVGRDRDDGR
jgi:ribosome biogenesis GTPase